MVANHSGTVPVDAVMLQAGLYDEHPARRTLRLLGADLVYEISSQRETMSLTLCPVTNARAASRAASM